MCSCNAWQSGTVNTAKTRTFLMFVYVYMHAYMRAINTVIF